MRFNSYLVEKYTFQHVQDLNIGKDGLHEYKVTTKRLILLISDERGPKYFLEHPNRNHIYRVIIPSLDFELRYGSGMPNNYGSIEIKFQTPHTFTVWGDISGNKIVRDASPGEIEGFTEEFLKKILKEENIRILTDFVSNKITSIPSNVKGFIDNFIGAGGWDNPKKWSEAWKPIYTWFQKKYGPTINKPPFVFRGIRLSSGQLKDASLNISQYKPNTVIQYKHWTNYPISTSTSRQIANDYCDTTMQCVRERSEAQMLLMLKFIDFAKEDIVLDARLFRSVHGAQTEILLRPDKTYAAKIERLYYIKDRKLIQSYGPKVPEKWYLGD